MTHSSTFGSSIFRLDNNIEEEARKVDARLSGKGNSNSHRARPVHPIITMMKRIGSSRFEHITLSPPGTDHPPRITGFCTRGGADSVPLTVENGVSQPAFKVPRTLNTRHPHVVRVTLKISYASA